MDIPDYRARLIQAREEKGWSIHETAWRMEEAAIASRSNYYDIEQCAEELTENCPLAKVSRICQSLGIRPRDLFCLETTNEMTVDDVVRAIRVHCIKNQIPFQKFEDTVGWRVESCLDDPKNALREWSIVALKDICDALDIDWCGIVAGLE